MFLEERRCHGDVQQRPKIFEVASFERAKLVERLATDALGVEA